MIGQAEWLTNHFVLLLGICVVGSLIVVGIYLLIEEIRFRVARRQNRRRNRN